MPYQYLRLINAIAGSCSIPLFVYTRALPTHVTLIGCWRQFQPDSFVGPYHKKAHPTGRSCEGHRPFLFPVLFNPVLLLTTDDSLVGCWRHVTVSQGHSFNKIKKNTSRPLFFFVLINYTFLHTTLYEKEKHT